MAEYQECFRGIFEHLHDRAKESLDGDDDADTALRNSQQFCAFAELVNCFGTALIAFEDIDGTGTTIVPSEDDEAGGMN